ncbi:prolyl oligopeptidase family serine peptidase [Mucilaginibacter corticis]|uniref:Prolyl oligopeptidase family serine peptidase n=1 Tax=Mucilaginibacter corticis TaxID=2597670 RepID=A0A556MKQ2_9SPHI|nr:prolyl oligopeptidase family serine peptidase [Mucilaginibacter corticis]TSJ40494.1 prolyl oligopeptidase family serine peptidase [Mucilaginibacter corticis]
MKISRPTRSVVSCFVFCLLALNSFAQRERFTAKKFVDKAGDTLRYCILDPDGDTLRSTPLVIFLHGSGERGLDNQAQLKWGVMNFATDQMMAMHPAVVIAPQCPPNEQWANVSRTKGSVKGTLNAQPSKSMQALRELIDQVIKTQHVDPKRIYITGLSMGGFGTFDALERYPDLFAAALPVCGGGDASKISIAAHVPMWICAGADDPTVNNQYSFDMVTELRKAGARPGFTLYPETGHLSWLSVYSDPHIMEWLFSQSKK